MLSTEARKGPGSGRSTALLNGAETRVLEGETILDALLRNQIAIPHICYHPQLGPLRTCDTCLVEVNGKIVRACDTSLAPGASVGVDTPRAKAARRIGMDRLLNQHSVYCTICDKNGNCALHDAILAMRVPSQHYEPKPYPPDESNPFYLYDPGQCLAIGRCVQACQAVVTNEVISMAWHLTPPRVVWDGGRLINESSCVSCGACVSACPVNALMEKSMVGHAGVLTGADPVAKKRMIDSIKTWETSFTPLMAMSSVESAMRDAYLRKTKTVCPYCAVGCTFNVWTRDRQILRIEPLPESPANGIATCIKGKFAWGHINAPDRLTRPLLREGDHFREATWKEAIDLIAKRFREIKAAHGPDALGFVVSCTSTNEEAYLSQKFARGVIGTNNIDNCARYCQSPASMGLSRTVGIGADAGRLEDMATAELVILIGSNTSISHPVLAGKLKAAKKFRGQKHIVLDVRHHTTARGADLFLRVQPGSDLFVLNAVAKYIIDQGWEDRRFIEENVEGFEEYKKSLARYTLDYAAELSGVPARDMVRMAEMIHASRATCIGWAMGVTQHQAGSETSTAIPNLLLLTGNYRRPSTGGYPLRGHANVQGVDDFGTLPEYYPGYEKAEEEEVVRKYEAAWGVSLPREKGKNEVEMVDLINEGKIHALYVAGEDKLLADGPQGDVEKALKKLDFLVVQELFLTLTAQYADVVLPAAASLEKEGTFVNTERRIQRLYAAMPPLGEAKSEFDTMILLARAFGHTWKYDHPRQVMDEVAGLCEVFAGVNYDRLEGFQSLQWPVKKDGTDSPILYTEKFKSESGKAKFHPTEHIEPHRPSAEFDLLLSNGRELEQFHWGNLTRRTPEIMDKAPGTFVEVSEELARERGLKDGDEVRITSPWGSAPFRVQLSTTTVSGKFLWIPLLEASESHVNLLLGRSRDKTTSTPAYKEIPVKLELLRSAPSASSPLPPSNPRFGHPTPVQGVNVEEKWRRPDYRFPGELV
jgi:formate dehydrogenase major subunit